MTAVKRFKNALPEFRVKDDIVAQIFQGYETVSDRSKKEKRAAFFVQAIERMESLLGRQLCHDIRDACACSKGGWRLKAMQKIAKECEDQKALRGVRSFTLVELRLNDFNFLSSERGPILLNLRQTLKSSISKCCRSLRDEMSVIFSPLMFNSFSFANALKPLISVISSMLFSSSILSSDKNLTSLISISVSPLGILSISNFFMFFRWDKSLNLSS